MRLWLQIPFKNEKLEESDSKTTLNHSLGSRQGRCYLQRILSHKFLEKIKGFIKDREIFIAVDGTTDVCGRAMDAIATGPLNEEFSSKGYLPNLVDITNTKNLNQILQKFLNNAIVKLYDGKV